MQSFIVLGCLEVGEKFRWVGGVISTPTTELPQLLLGKVEVRLSCKKKRRHNQTNEDDLTENTKSTTLRLNWEVCRRLDGNSSFFFFILHYLFKNATILLLQPVLIFRCFSYIMVGRPTWVATCLLCIISMTT